MDKSSMNKEKLWELPTSTFHEKFYEVLEKKALRPNKLILIVKVNEGYLKND